MSLGADMSYENQKKKYLCRFSRRERGLPWISKKEDLTSSRRSMRRKA